MSDNIDIDYFFNDYAVNKYLSYSCLHKQLFFSYTEKHWKKRLLLSKLTNIYTVYDKAYLFINHACIELLMKDKSFFNSSEIEFSFIYGYLIDDYKTNSMNDSDLNKHAKAIYKYYLRNSSFPYPQMKDLMFLAPKYRLLYYRHKNYIRRYFFELLYVLKNKNKKGKKI